MTQASDYLNFLTIDTATRIIIPTINDWVFLFDNKHGQLNRMNVVKAYTQFMTNPNAKELSLPGICVIGGSVHDHSKFKKGDKICTSYIRKLSIVDEDSPYFGLIWPKKDTVVLVAETGSNNLYRIDYQERNRCMSKMETDFVRKGRLSEVPKAYVPAFYAQYDFL